MVKCKINTVLFGLDGVIVDTEGAYDRFWNSVAEENGLKIDNFASVIKGLTINVVIDLYFTLLSVEEKMAIIRACSEMEMGLYYAKISIPGVLDFIRFLRESDYKIGIVTNSSSAKAKAALGQLSLEDAFDTVITSDSIKKGKPDPVGYVLAKTNLGVQSGECIVFEDTFAGIKAATYAFMRVVGVSTILPEEFLKDYTYGVIPDFSNLEKVKALLY